MSADQIGTIIERLKARWPQATYELDWQTPEQMLVATSLAAQCTDERVRAVTKTLFVKYPDPKSFAEADPAELEEELKPTGFYRQKTKAVLSINKALVSKHGGKIPRDMAKMVKISGVARKTANVVLNCCFNDPTGVIVDTHVHRVSQRMGLSKQSTPEAIEQDLMALVPQDEWTFFGPAMVLHGRYTCTAKNPDCADCVYLDLCPRVEVDGPRPEGPPRLPPPVTSEPDLDAWVQALGPEFDKPYFKKLMAFIDQERAEHQVFPPEDEVFSAFSMTAFDAVKVVILGQDPYHDDDQAHGLSFSVKPGVKVPPSLANMVKELKTDVGATAPKHGFLGGWASQGVLMLNAVLTVRAHSANSHKDQGWETFTDAVIQTLNNRAEHIVFVLWGGYAQKKGQIIDRTRHSVIECAHPSPLSAKKFFGSKPFSQTNEALQSHGQSPIDWSHLPDR